MPLVSECLCELQHWEPVQLCDCYAQWHININGNSSDCSFTHPFFVIMPFRLTSPSLPALQQLSNAVAARPSQAPLRRTVYDGPTAGNTRGRAASKYSCSVASPAQPSCTSGGHWCAWCRMFCSPCSSCGSVSPDGEPCDGHSITDLPICIYISVLHDHVDKLHKESCITSHHAQHAEVSIEMLKS